MSDFVPISAIAEATGKTERTLEIAVARIVSGRATTWRGAQLIVRTVKGRGGKSGVRYEIRVDSLPIGLQERFKAYSQPAEPRAFVHKLAAVRTRLAQLHKASEAALPELYNMMYHYMELAGLDAQRSMEALEKNFLQGRKGAFELKDLAHGLPSLIGLGKTYGLTGEQLSTDLPALLQIFRKVTGTAYEADTRLRHIMTKLTDPHEAKNIKKELGVDIYRVREKAMKAGADPLFAVLDAVTQRLKLAGNAAGKLNHETHAVEGVDVRKLGAIARDYYFRAGLEAYTQLRNELKEFTPTAAQARIETQQAFAANMSTAAASAERLSNAFEALRIKAATPFLPLEKGLYDSLGKEVLRAGEFAEKHPLRFAAASLGGAVGLWGAAGAATRYAVFKTGQVLGEGMASTAAGGAAGGFVGGLGRGVLASLWRAGPLGILAAVASQATVDTDRAREVWEDINRWREEHFHKDTASEVFERMRHGETTASVFDRMRQLPTGTFLPTFAQGQPQPQPLAPIGPAYRAPTFAMLEGVPGSGAAPTSPAGPHVDTSDFHRAEQEARDTGAHIKEALDVTVAPSVETSAIERALDLARQLRRELEGIGPAATKAGASALRGLGSHALHDGPEAH